MNRVKVVATYNGSRARWTREGRWRVGRTEVTTPRSLRNGVFRGRTRPIRLEDPDELLGERELEEILPLLTIGGEYVRGRG